MTAVFWPPRQHDDYDRFYPPSWIAFALCAEVDTDLFYPEKGGSTLYPKRVCAACPVRAQCLDDALERDEPHGIWGGLSPAERRRLKRRQAA